MIWGKENRRKEKRREGGKKEGREEDKGRIIYGYRNMYSETLKVLIRLANLHLQVYTFKHTALSNLQSTADRY